MNHQSSNKALVFESVHELLFLTSTAIWETCSVWFGRTISLVSWAPVGAASETEAPITFMIGYGGERSVVVILKLFGCCLWKGKREGVFVRYWDFPKLPNKLLWNSHFRYRSLTSSPLLQVLMTKIHCTVRRARTIPYMTPWQRPLQLT